MRETRARRWKVLSKMVALLLVGVLLVPAVAEAAGNRFGVTNSWTNQWGTRIIKLDNGSRCRVLFSKVKETPRDQTGRTVNVFFKYTLTCSLHDDPVTHGYKLRLYDGWSTPYVNTDYGRELDCDPNCEGISFASPGDRDGYVSTSFVRSTVMVNGSCKIQTRYILGVLNGLDNDTYSRFYLGKDLNAGYFMANRLCA